MPGTLSCFSDKKRIITERRVTWNIHKVQCILHLAIQQKCNVEIRKTDPRSFCM